MNLLPVLSVFGGMVEWLRGGFTNARKHPFVFVAMLTAFPYTAWCAANVLHGLMPVDENARFLYWLTAVLFATTVDIGAVSASSHLSEKWGIVDFLAFLAMVSGMWYVQTLYALIHYAPLTLSPAIPIQHRETAQALVDAAVWLMPVFIPVPLVINALRGLRIPNILKRLIPGTDGEIRVMRVEPAAPPSLPKQPIAALVSDTPKAVNVSGAHTGEATGLVYALEDGRYGYTCPKCGRVVVKDTIAGAQSSLNVHTGKYCPARKSVVAVSVENAVEVVDGKGL